MAIYLIDYENVKKLNGIEKLNQEDKIYIFYSKNSDKLTFDTHKEIMNSKASITYMEVAVGEKNALDFQLATFLGYLIKEYEDEKICIVAQDKGYTYIIDFWKKIKNRDIELYIDLIGTKKSVNNDSKPKEVNIISNNDMIKNLKNSSLGLSDNDLNEVSRIVAQYKTKQTINVHLSKYFRDNEKVSKINSIIKPFIKGKK